MSTSHNQELDKLLSEVRKTIIDNEQFLKNLLDDSDDADKEETDRGEGENEEEFEEL